MTSVKFAVLVPVVVAALVTSACRKEDQNRPLSFEPGVYRGQKVDDLSKATVRQLQDRGALQK